MKEVISKKVVFCPFCDKEHLVEYGCTNESYLVLRDNNGQNHKQQYTSYYLKCNETGKCFEDDFVYAKNLLQSTEAKMKILNSL